MVSLKKKLLISILSGILFLIISLPFTYKLVNEFTSKMGLDIESGGCPNMKGIAVHSVVFVLVTFIIMLF
jgi:hypothetical protein